MEKLKNVKVGDKLTRLIAGVVPMTVVVGEITDKVIKCGSIDGTVAWEEGWTFDRKTGAEIDEDLYWNSKGITGSYIKN